MNNDALNHDVSPKIYKSLTYNRMSGRFLLRRLKKQSTPARTPKLSQLPERPQSPPMRQVISRFLGYKRARLTSRQRAFTNVGNWPASEV